MTYRPYNQLTATGISDDRSNNTGVLIGKGTPVRINTSGELDFIDVSVEAESLAVAGVTTNDISNGAKGSMTNTGKVEDITTTASLGDTLYVSKTGGLTNTKPSIGVGGFLSGDFVIGVGVVAKNESNPLLKDLVLNIAVIGQL